MRAHQHFRAGHPGDDGTTEAKADEFQVREHFILGHRDWIQHCVSIHCWTNFMNSSIPKVSRLRFFYIIG